MSVAITATLLGSTPVDASVFGDALLVSPIGTRLSVEIASPGMTRENLAGCVRLQAAPSEDGVATLRGGRLELAGSGANARIVVSHAEPVFEPILRFALEDVCSTRLRRTYTLLMPEPAQIARPVAREAGPAAARPSPSRPSVAAGPGGRTWTTVQGESVASIAQAMYPRDEGARRAFVDGTVKSNPELFAAGRHPASVLPTGTELRVPALAGVAAASSIPRTAARAGATRTTAERAPVSPPLPAPAQTVAPVTPPAPAAVATESDRLLIDTGRRDELAGSAIEAEATDELRREERLVAAIDRSIDAQLELFERIRRLEALQVALRAQIDAATPAGQPVPMQQLGATVPAAPTPPHAPGIDAAPEERIAERQAPAPAAPPPGSNWFNWAIAGGVLALALLLLIRRRSEDAPTGTATRSAPAPMTQAWPADAPAGAGVDRQRQTEAPALSEHTLPPALPPVIEWDEPAARDTAQAVDEASSDMPTLPPAVVVEQEPEEHESAVELADIMLSFGRVHGAAETLEAFIESNPKQAIMPWLKLMEVYHTADMQREFDILAAELNKTFNVRAVTWDNFRDVSAHGAGIEALAHISARLQETWGTRQCQAYIDLLVRDNRQGTRMGFELGAVDDLLMLAGVLELQLGRYKQGA